MAPLAGLAAGEVSWISSILVYERTMRLQQATSRDDEFCFSLHEASMREYVEPVYGWDADFQRTYHAQWFEPDRLLIIEDDDGPAVGVLDVSDEGDHLYLSRIEILPEEQGRGLGTAVVGDLLRRGRMVRLHVFTNNARARGSTNGLASRSKARESERIGSRCSIQARRPTGPRPDSLHHLVEVPAVGHALRFMFCPASSNHVGWAARPKVSARSGARARRTLAPEQGDERTPFIGDLVSWATSPQSAMALTWPPSWLGTSR
jgi:GNAT superfamily N-acetyltransferase